MVPVPKHDRQQAQQRQHAAGQREEEELDRRVTPLFAAPDADEEEQRHERELEEQVEENNVAGDEHAQHARAQHEQQAVVERLLVLDRVPTYQHGDDQQQGRQREEPEAQAVQGDAELDVQRAAQGGEPRQMRARRSHRPRWGSAQPARSPPRASPARPPRPSSGHATRQAGQDRGRRRKQQGYEQQGLHRTYHNKAPTSASTPSAITRA